MQRCLPSCPPQCRSTPLPPNDGWATYGYGFWGALFSWVAALLNTLPMLFRSTSRMAMSPTATPSTKPRASPAPIGRYTHREVASRNGVTESWVRMVAAVSEAMERGVAMAESFVGQALMRRPASGSGRPTASSPR
jgi:hypothetical protein